MARSTQQQWLSFGRISPRRPGYRRPPTGQGRTFRRRLRFEPLEHRRLLSMTVNTLVDEADGSIVDGDVSLRDAIALAPTGETIDFAPALTSGGPAAINLTLGELVVDKNLAIDGPGANLLTIDAQHNSRVFNIDDGNLTADKTVAISGLTLTGGFASDLGGAIFSTENLSVTGSTISANFSDNFGGGIYNVGNLTVTSSMISGNEANHGGGGIVNSGNLTVTSSTISGNSAYSDRGGGIANFFGNLTVTSSTIGGNSAGDGGGIYIRNGDAVITNSMISGNSAFNYGGGISSDYGNLTVTSSTISGNSTNGRGGGINHDSGNLTVTRSTINGNSAYAGGGIFSNFGDLTVTHSTISGNSVVYGGGGGGIQILSYSITELSHTIVAGNTSGAAATPNDVSGIVTLAFSLLGVDTGATITNNGGNLIGTAGSPIDPLLGPLTDNGGPTLTHTLSIGSPAIDAGDPAAVAGMGGVPLFDQRGFDRVVDGDNVGGARIDIGAVEVRFLKFVVDTLADENDGNHSAGDLSLREALSLANASVYTSDMIEFDPALAGGTILLTMGELVITDSVAIIGLGDDLLTIDASGNDPTPNSTLQDGDNTNDGDGSRAFNIDDGNFSADKSISISGLTLTGGDTGSGGAILTQENLTVTNSTISGNSGFLGGGITNSSTGTLTVTDSTITGNSANGGGGIYFFGHLTVTGSTISGNSAHVGGGIGTFYGNLAVTDSTISGNSANFGGGIFSDYGTLTMINSTLSGNFGAGGGIYSRGGNLTVTDSTIGDNSATNSRGGGIWQNDSNLTVTRSTISDNDAIEDGGGIYNQGGLVTVIDSTVNGNSAGNEGGGGIFNVDGSLTVSGSTISGNSARSGDGGGIFSSGLSTLTLTDSTISGNSASGRHGGGIYIYAGGSLTVTSSTISGNSAFLSGGGIFSAFNDNVTVSDSTISSNSAGGAGGGIATLNLTLIRSTISGNSAGTEGGGIATIDGGSTELSHTIVAGNTRASIPSDVFGSVTLAFSLLGVDTGATITNNGGNLIGTAGSPIDPMLGPLTDNGGPTLTHALLAGSPAIDAGNPAAPTVLPGILVSQNLGTSAYTASQSAPGAESESAFDGIVADGWNAGSYPIQWLEVDLQQPHALTSLRLYVDQFPGGNTIHEIWVANSAIQNDLSGATLIHSFVGFTSDLDVLMFTLPSTVVAQFVQIRTTESPSWVAWDEVQVFADIPLYDQRGAPFGRVVDGNTVPGARIDMGAVERQPIPPAVFGDYNQNGDVDASDYVVWRKTLGSNVAPYSGADGSGNGIVDQADRGVWMAHFGQTLPPPGAGSAADVNESLRDSVVAETTVSERLSYVGSGAIAEDPHPLDNWRPLPAGEVIRTSEVSSASANVERSKEAVESREARGEFFAPRASLDSAHRPDTRVSRGALPALGAGRYDDALVAWLASQEDATGEWSGTDAATRGDRDDAEKTAGLAYRAVDEVLARLAGNWE